MLKNSQRRLCLKYLSNSGNLLVCTIRARSSDKATLPDYATSVNTSTCHLSIPAYLSHPKVHPTHPSPPQNVPQVVPSVPQNAGMTDLSTVPTRLQLKSSLMDKNLANLNDGPQLRTET